MFRWLQKNSGGKLPKARSPVRAMRLRRIFDETHDLAWRSLRRFGVHRERLEDAFQEVFLTVSERLDDIDPGKERSFVYGVTLRVARASQRTRWREVLGEELEVPAESTLGAEAVMDQGRLLEVCDRILDKLAADLREVFVLHELEGLSGAEVASVLGIPSGTVHSRLRRARQLVRAEVEALVARRTTSEVRRG